MLTSLVAVAVADHLLFWRAAASERDRWSMPLPPIALRSVAPCPLAGGPARIGRGDVAGEVGCSLRFRMMARSMIWPRPRLEYTRSLRAPTTERVGRACSLT